MASSDVDNTPWYRGITNYQWLVLLIASLGWVFDIFEGQIFVTSMNEAMPSLLPTDLSAEQAQGEKAYYNNIALASFLLGGSLGGVLFGMLSDRIGRSRTMIITILMYSLFTCVTAMAQTPWQMIVLRFLVAMGVGGEWAVASAMVAEVFPKRARARSLGIFHATSSLGTFLAIAAGAFIVGNEDLGWRWGFAIGALPALLTIWIRLKLREPDSWVQAKQAAAEDAAKQTGRIGDLFRRDLIRHTAVGVSLATIGLATFWGVRIYGKDLMRAAAERRHVAEAGLPADAPADVIKPVLDAGFESIKDTEMIGHLLVTIGGFIGLLSFGPITERIGRRPAFAAFHLAGFVSGLVLFTALADANEYVLYIALPLFGYMTLGMHAGYAIYFPELFPTRLRGTGGGFCFNMGRLFAASVLLLTGWMQRSVEKDGLGWTLEQTAAALSGLFLLGLIVLAFAPETRGRELPQ